MRSRWLIVVFLIAGLGYGCAPTGGAAGRTSMIQPGERPDQSSVEAGLWMAMDKFEEQLKTSGRVVEDPELNRYIRGQLCKVTPRYCADVRIYIVSSPNFNASMTPNGVMTLWTGMLLRMDNEAQLAFVLGHEMAHYLHRDSLHSWRDARSKLDALVFVQLAAIAGGAVAGVGSAGNAAGQLIGLMVQGSIFAFSRENERQSDRSGLEMVVKAGYDTAEAPRIWEALMKEREAGSGSQPSIFFSTHPSDKERLNNLKAQAQSLAASENTSVVGRHDYQRMISPWRLKWLEDELHQREFNATQVLLDRLVEQGARLGELYFIQGELHRLRGDDTDNQKALDAYRKSVAAVDPPAQAYRSMGLVLSRLGDALGARQAYEEYLRVHPGAADRKMMEWYISELK